MGEDPHKIQVTHSGHSSVFRSRSEGRAARKEPKRTPSGIGPGTYGGHGSYSFQKSPVPFNSKNERFNPPSRGKDKEKNDEMASKLGPGCYLGPTEPGAWKSQPNHAPFNQKRDRMPTDVKPSTPSNLGPGCYIGHGQYNITQAGVGFLAKAGSDKTAQVQAKAKTEADELARSRGPGQYIGHPTWKFGSNHAPFNCKTPRQTETKQERKAAASVRSKSCPGFLLGHSKWKEAGAGAAPFGCKTDRFAKDKKATATGDNEALGPGSYIGHMHY